MFWKKITKQFRRDKISIEKNLAMYYVHIQQFRRESVSKSCNGELIPDKFGLKLAVFILKSHSFIFEGPRQVSWTTYPATLKMRVSSNMLNTTIATERGNNDVPISTLNDYNQLSWNCIFWFK